MKARLMAEMGPGKPRLGLELGSDEVTIGRDFSCTICIEGGGISRVHARLVRTARGYMILDDSSANGVFVNGERTTHKLLSNGDSFRLGTSVFTYTEEEPLEQTILEAADTAKIETGPPVREPGATLLLVVRSSPVEGLAGRQFEVEKDDSTIGRDSRNDIPVPDKKASRLHSRLVREERRFFLLDNHSGNGTYLRGERIERAEIHQGDVFRIGETEIEVLKGPRAPAPKGPPTDNTPALRPAAVLHAAPPAAPLPKPSPVDRPEVRPSPPPPPPPWEKPPSLLPPSAKPQPDPAPLHPPERSGPPPLPPPPESPGRGAATSPCRLCATIPEPGDIYCGNCGNRLT